MTDDTTAAERIPHWRCSDCGYTLTANFLVHCPLCLSDNWAEVDTTAAELAEIPDWLGPCPECGMLQNQDVSLGWWMCDECKHRSFGERWQKKYTAAELAEIRPGTWRGHKCHPCPDKKPPRVLVTKIQMDPKQIALALYVAVALHWLKFMRHGRPLGTLERAAWDVGLDATLKILRSV